MRKPARTTFTRICIIFLVSLLVLFATACGGSSSSKDSATSRSAEKTLYIYNWSYYTPDSVIEAFEKEFGVDVVLDYYASNEEMFAKLMAGGQGYDLILPSGDYVSIMKNLNMLLPLDHSKLPNLVHVGELVRSKATYDPAMEYSVPYYMGAAGVAVNTDFVKGYAKSWDIFADSHYANRMSMLDDMREVLGDALASLGYSVNTKDAAELEQARALVNAKWKPNLVKFDAEGFAKSFSAGEFWIIQGYAEAIFEELPENMWSKVDFFLPEEGGPMYIDSFVIPKGAKNINLAHEFINFIHKPEIYAQFLDRFHFPASVNPDAEQFRTTVPFYTTEEMVDYEQKADLGDYLQEYNRAWETIRYIE
ncbi:extracellular solute-binding protein [Parasphaerochaeta coccoides]|uniref:Extracellular solute-binding protein family 1 n=1 Tax=Parasphaerochaeta coccoides (strain ATCC BAA-1237 / DSM 17374 / SPN1) TaxID=760011 RepID=F4GM30_PARC1|nr:extracellular solute-binding protein [Parasphaerochaeta coccoides]AEC02505.1 extracellular solute-binding protein family 1 [Parasphaerochaeta coccoides DSM 17374]